MSATRVSHALSFPARSNYDGCVVDLFEVPRRAEDDLRKLLGPLETELVRAAWTLGEPATVRQLLDVVNARRSRLLAYTTVMTVMNRLAEKGVFDRHKRGRGYVYEATASDSAGFAVRGVMRDFGDAAMAHFVEEARGDPDVLRRLRRLLEEES